jgi:drug/metabolite transporter (DMT)-like permease
MARDRDRLTGTLAAVAAASLFGMLGPLSRFAAEDGVEGVAFTAWRAGLAFAFLAVLIVAGGRTGTAIASLRGLPRAGRIGLSIAAVSGLVLNAAIFTAFGRIPIALALMLFYTYPAGVVVLDVLLGHERLTPSRLAALVLSTAGVALVLAGGPAEATAVPIDAVGIALGLLAAACQVLFVMVSRTSYRSVPADVATLVLEVVAAAGAIVLALVAGQAAGLVAPFQSADPWPALLVAGIGSAGIAAVLFLGALRRIGGTTTGILMLFEPVVGVALAAAWLGEEIGALQALGGALVLAGALVLQVRAAPDQEPVIETAAGPLV